MDNNFDISKFAIEPNLLQKSQYKASANDGNADAMLQLGVLYLEDFDFIQAKDWFLKAAKADNAEAMFRLGLIYQNGMGLDKDHVKAIEWYEKAVEGNNAEAMCHLGWLYQNGICIEQDYVKAITLYKRAVDAGNASAMYLLGWLYQNGMGIDQNFMEARELYERATEAGNVLAICGLAWLYQSGSGVAQNFTKAKELYEHAAEAGNTVAMCWLAWFYQYGLGVAQDYTKAKELYERAADNGNSNALFNLGWLYQEGLGVTSNYIQAFEFYEKAAETGHAAAMYNLGVFYQQGLGVTSDLQQSREWYERAAEAGNAAAMSNLGWLYQYGLGMTPDLQQAIEWYERAAEAGNAVSMYNLGWLYQHGLDTTVDIIKARNWYKQAVEHGNVAASYNLGLLYKEGELKDIDLTQARNYLIQAAKAGFSAAWIELVKLDYIDENKYSNTDGNDFLDSWKSWVSNPTHRTTALPEPYGWVGDFINLVMMISKSEIDDQKEFWHILAIVRLLAQHQQAKHLITKETVLYHFTRFDVLEKLLPNPETNAAFRDKNILRCYHVSYMNDPSEGQRLLNFKKDEANDSELHVKATKGAKSLNKWFENKTVGNYFHQLDNAHVVSSLPASVFTASFTKRPDSLDLWRAYGNDGLGISIGFPVSGTKNIYLQQRPIIDNSVNEPIIPINNNTSVKSDKIDNISGGEDDTEARYYNVAYDDDSVAETIIAFVPLLERLEMLLCVIDDDDEKWTKIARKHITESLLHILYLFKDEEYASEKEVRAIKIYPLKHKAVRRDERIPRRLYCELSGCHLFTEPNSKVIIGPKVDDSNAMIWDARHLLTLHGYDKTVAVKRSDVKYR
ncbi:DUF2971 domain-containing protein [Aeromonas hydrophila]|uniref:DUF2971 domain-containing protein n=1 Tax=Aeromonas hydrophila TaxID=644 RepID=UPI002B485C53|nr:DUF2971 domain-containing protein [Aeromonas hydrophila]